MVQSSSRNMLKGLDAHVLPTETAAAADALIEGRTPAGRNPNDSSAGNAYMESSAKIQF